MSFLSDVFHGNFSNLGADITHAPESLVSHPDQLAETLGVGALGLGGLGLAGGLSGVGDLFGSAASGIGNLASDVGTGVSNAFSGIGNLFGGGASTAADVSPSGALYGVPDASGVTLQNPATFAYTGTTPDPIVSPATAGDAASTAGDVAASSTTAGAPAAGATGDTTSTLGSIGSYLKNNAGLLTLGGAGLAANLAAPALAKMGLTGSIPNQSQLTGIANQAGSAAGGANAYATQLEQALTSGQLPSGAQAQVNQALQDSITGIKAKYANLGLSGSTMEQEAITAAQSQAQQMQFQIAQQMAQTGLQAASQATQDLGLQSSVYQALTSAQISQDTALQNAIASFTGAVGGGIGRGAAQSAFQKAAS